MSAPSTIDPGTKLVTGNADLKARLEQLATRDFDAFLTMLVSMDGVQIFVCAEREKELSFGQIAVRLRAAGIDLTRQAVADRCKKCQGTIYRPV